MNYNKIYDNLIKTAISREIHDNVYYEQHHILPKCLGGANDDINLVNLTGREHYIAHWLLYKIHPLNWKIAHAFFWMATKNGINQRSISSVQYERAKLAMSKSCSDRTKLHNPMFSDTAKKKISENMKGDNNPMRRFPERNHILNGGLTPSMGGAKWYNNGIKSQYFRLGDEIPENWVEGMAPYGERGRWITNGYIVRRLKGNENMPNGFKYGMKKIK